MDEPVGVMEKMEAHRKGALHRAFSVFIFDNKGYLLLQQRAPGKYHGGGLWTNACCSHPYPGELILQAARRRLMEELGFEADIKEVFSFIVFSNCTKGEWLSVNALIIALVSVRLCGEFN